MVSQARLASAFPSNFRDANSTSNDLGRLVAHLTAVAETRTKMRLVRSDSGMDGQCAATAQARVLKVIE